MAPPVKRAAWITPDCTRCRGPRGPSGVKARSNPWRNRFTMARRAMLPPVEFDPRVMLNPNDSIARLMNSPSWCRLIMMETRFPE